MALVLDNGSASLLYGIPEFPTAVMAVDLPTDLSTGIEISEGGRPHRIPGELEGQRRAGHPGKAVTHGEAQLSVQAQRAGMIGGMDESHPQVAPCGSPVEHSLHKVSADGAVLHRGRNRNRAEAGDGGAFVEKVTANDAPIQLCYNRI
jgi:hypothetical protein